jgi:hypothetical protein
MLASHSYVVREVDADWMETLALYEYCDPAADVLKRKA